MRRVGNLLALAVLSYLTRGPMHSYELGRTLREHDDVRGIKFSRARSTWWSGTWQGPASSSSRKPPGTASAWHAPEKLLAWQYDYRIDWDRVGPVKSHYR